MRKGGVWAKNLLTLKNNFSNAGSGKIEGSFS